MAETFIQNFTFDQFIDLNGESSNLASPEFTYFETLPTIPHTQQIYPLNSSYTATQHDTPLQDVASKEIDCLLDWTRTGADQFEDLTTSLSKINTYFAGDGPVVQYGQITPPMSTASMLEIEESKAESRLNEDAESTTSSNHKTEEKIAATIASPKTPRKTRKKKYVTKNSQNEAAKRDKFLERNRIAASKCRQKKKVWTNCLDDEARELKATRDTLGALASSLKEELLYLKGEMLRHAACDSPEIKAYLHQQVGKIAGTGCAHCCPNKNVNVEAPKHTHATSSIAQSA